MKNLKYLLLITLSIFLFNSCEIEEFDPIVEEEVPEIVDGETTVNFFVANDGGSQAVKRFDDVYIRVDVEPGKAIEKIQLEVTDENGFSSETHVLRSEKNAPYEWGFPHTDQDEVLNGIEKGISKIKANIHFVDGTIESFEEEGSFVERVYFKTDIPFHGYVQVGLDQLGGAVDDPNVEALILEGDFNRRYEGNSFNISIVDPELMRLEEGKSNTQVFGEKKGIKYLIGSFNFWADLHTTNSTITTPLSVVELALQMPFSEENFNINGDISNKPFLNGAKVRIAIDASIQSSIDTEFLMSYTVRFRERIMSINFKKSGIEVFNEVERFDLFEKDMNGLTEVFIAQEDGGQMSISTGDEVIAIMPRLNPLSYNFSGTQKAIQEVVLEHVNKF